eukprot:Colp12_sorted_trinity150504_noHs@12611
MLGTGLPFHSVRKMDIDQPTHRPTLKSRAPWRAAFKERCMARLHEARKEYINRRRHLNDNVGMEVEESSSYVDDILRSEYERYCEEMQKEANMNKLNLNDLYSDLQEFTMELRQEEELLVEEILRQYEEVERFEQGIVEAQVESFCGSTSVQVPCPVCAKHNLMLNKGVVFCPCGLRLNTQQDSFVLEDIRNAISCVVEQHGSCCTGTPCFFMESNAGFSALMLTCQLCDTLEVVL